MERSGILGSIELTAATVMRRGPKIYPVGWGQPSKHRKQASPRAYVAPEDETRQQRRARQRREAKAAGFR